LPRWRSQGRGLLIDDVSGDEAREGGGQDSQNNGASFVC
jgi:hypothetical protein